MDTTVRSIAFTGDVAQAFTITATPAAEWRVALLDTPSGKEHPRDRDCRIVLRGALGGFKRTVTPLDVRANGLDASMTATGLDGAVLHAALIASGDAPRVSATTTVVHAEVSLTGALRAPRGLYAAVMAAHGLGVERVIVATQGAAEARRALRDGARCTVVAVPDLPALAEALAAVESYVGIGGETLTPAKADAPVTTEQCDFSDLRVPPTVVRAITVAIAGRHNLSFTAQHGAGVVAIARRLRTVVPFPEATRLESSQIFSLAGLTPPEPGSAPFRAPHHTVSAPGLWGGGVPFRPGEVSLAHGGVLLLDEVNEFSRATIEGAWAAQRQGPKAKFHSRPALIVTANVLCYCGRAADACACSLDARRRFAARLRDIVSPNVGVQVFLPTFKIDEANTFPRVTSAELRATIEAAQARLAAAGDKLMVRGTDATVALDVASRTALDPAKERAVLTSLARTIAAIDGARAITSDHINEASTFYRHVERQAFLGAYGKDVDHVSAG